MSRFLKESLKSLTAYTPGEQPQDRKYIKLNTNESPFAPSQEVIKALSPDAISRLRLYCDPTARVLKETLAESYGLKSENVFVANGSDDILNFAFMAFSENGAVFPDISYGFYKVFARLYGVDYTEKPLDSNFEIDTGDYLNTGKLTVIANPNAPTGIALPLSEIEKIVKSNKDNVVVIDEAYVDFGAESAVSLINKYDNLLVVMTYSKSRSMAGGRLGFAFASREIISDLEKIKYSTNPYNVNSLTQLAGIATIKDQDYYNKNAKIIIENREFTTLELRKLGFTVLNSKANFIFAKSDKIGGRELYLKLYENGILVRHFDTDRLRDFNRITIGTREEMETLISKIREILKEK